VYKEGYTQNYKLITKFTNQD